MRPSRLFVVIAVLFSASAFAVGPPGSQGPRQSPESSMQSSPRAEALPDTAVSPSQERIAQAPDNAWLNASPSNAWQSSAQRSEPQGMAPSDASTPGDSQSVPSTPAPKSDRENTPSPGEQSK
jgi:hypothetical protein